MKKSEILKDLKNGVQFGNYNTGFINTKDGEMIMCEYHKGCKYTIYRDINKFANRILKFTKTGY